MFPSLSIQSNIPTKLEAFNSTVENLTGEPNEKVVVLIVEDIALRDFFNKKYVGLPPDISYTVIFNEDMDNFANEEENFEEYAPDVFKFIRDKANGKIEALNDYVMVTANVDDLKKIFNVQMV